MGEDDDLRSDLRSSQPLCRLEGPEEGPHGVHGVLAVAHGVEGAGHNRDEAEVGRIHVAVVEADCNRRRSVGEGGHRTHPRVMDSARS